MLAPGSAALRHIEFGAVCAVALESAALNLMPVSSLPRVSALMNLVSGLIEIPEMSVAAFGSSTARAPVGKIDVPSCSLTNSPPVTLRRSGFKRDASLSAKWPAASVFAVAGTCRLAPFAGSTA